MTNLVNVSVKASGKSRSEWLADKNFVYIGRATRNGWKASPYRNPYRLQDQSPEERLRIMIAYEADLLRKGDSALKEWLEPLAGKTLGCWCTPLPCHGDILIKHLNRLGLE